VHSPADSAADPTAQALPDTALERTVFLADLATAAAGEQALQPILDRAVHGVARLLDHEYAKVLELLPDRSAVKLVSGVGWQPGLVGQATVGIGAESQAGYTLIAGGPVVVTDLRKEQRFWGPPLLRDHGVISGLSTVIPGPDGPWGVLGTHSTRHRAYSDADPLFVSAVAALIGAAVARLAAKRDGESIHERLTSVIAREEARSAELRAVIGAMGEGVVVFDELDRLLLMNDAAEQLLADEDVETLDALASALGVGEPAALESGRSEVRLGETGRWAEVAFYRVPLWAGIGQGGERHTHENRASSIVVVRDVTAARRAREARDAFLGVLSHELRTPITTIYGGAHVLTRELSPERRNAVVADLVSEADRLHRMVEDLLVLSRVERDGLEVVLEPLSLQRLIPHVLDAERARWPGHTFFATVPDAVPLVGADTTYVEQVLRNLLGNAAKFSPIGSGIEVSAASSDGAVVVSVLDNGAGFAAGEAERLFDLFYRSASAKRTPGSGIGLYVSRRLAEAMGGTLTARPRPEGGAEFSLKLRVYEP
jgi:signal transduction histidine kinase